MTDSLRGSCLHCHKTVGDDGQEVWPGQWWCAQGARIEVERLTAACSKCGGRVGPDGVRVSDAGKWLCRGCVEWIAAVGRTLHLTITPGPSR